jgi:glycosyltransferase involved in cell wall biosynthesis
MGALRGAMITQVVDAADPVLGFAVGWFNALAARVDRLEVVCLTRGAAALAPNIRVSVLPRGRLARFRRVRVLLRRLKRDGALDFILAHMCPSYVVAATLPTTLAPTFLWYAHSSVTGMLRMADRRCDRVFSCSQASYPLRSARLVVVGHGIDTERFTPSDEDRSAEEFRICSVARITKSKRLELLIEALARYRVRRPEARFTCRLVGPADEQARGSLGALIGRSGLGDRVRIEGPLPHKDVVHVYRDADVVANMTVRHSLDKATLEAMACGCLVLTTNEAFAPVLGPYAKLMVRPGASAEALAGALDDVASLPRERRHEIGRALRELVVAEHSLGQMMERVVTELGAVCAGGGTR